MLNCPSVTALPDSHLAYRLTGVQSGDFVSFKLYVQ